MKHTEYIIPIGEEAKEFDEMFIGLIRRQPELIRCKDCEWYEMGEEETYCRKLGIFNTDPTSYCSYARRKEE